MNFLKQFISPTISSLIYDTLLLTFQQVRAFLTFTAALGLIDPIYKNA